MSTTTAPGSDAQLQAARDELFRDADRHGPRWPVLVRRVVPAVALLLLAFALTCIEPWRARVIDAAGSDALADAVLVAPVLAAVVVLAAALAPVARVRVEPLLGGALVLLAAGLWLAADGRLAAAALPSAGGALLAGLAAARAVRRAVWTLPLLLAAGISDAVSVSGGITHDLLSGAGAEGARSAARAAPVLEVAAADVTRLDLLVMHVPAASGTWMLGLVDVVALGMLLGLAHLYWLPLPRTALALAAALVITIGVGIPVPVLPMLGLAWVLVHHRLVWRATRFSLRRLTYLGG